MRKIETATERGHRPPCPCCGKPIAHGEASRLGGETYCPHCDERIIYSQPILPPGPFKWERPVGTFGTFGR